MSKKQLQPPVKKNETVMLTIEDVTSQGVGVGKVDQYPIFTPYVLPGETAEVKVVKVKKNYAYGKLLKVIAASPERKKPPCDVFYQCGGCQVQHMSYQAQLDMKRTIVKNALAKIGHLEHVPVHPVIGMDEPYRYRNKIQMPVGEKDGKILMGFYQERSHRIISGMETCLIQNEVGDRIIATCRKLFNQLNIPAYDEINHTGVLRHVIVRTAYETNDSMVIFVTKTAKLPQQKALIQRLTEQHPEIKSIVHNINPQRTNVILGETTKTIYGADYIIDRIGSLQFKLSAKSFYQVNPVQTKVLYEKALEYAAVSADDIAIDAYCGIGTIALYLAQKAKKVYGVEVVPEAIMDAQENARLNGLDNVEFVAGEAETVLPQWQKAGVKPEVITVDPPRKGCDERFLQTMIEMQPKRIVYVSCNPATLARDLRILEDGGYRTLEVQPVDLFPQTYHVECVALLVKNVSN